MLGGILRQEGRITVQEDGCTWDSKLIAKEIAEWLASRGGEVREPDTEPMQEHVRYLLTRFPPQQLLSPKQRIRHLVCSFWAIIVARKYLRCSQLVSER